MCLVIVLTICALVPNVFSLSGELEGSCQITNPKKPYPASSVEYYECSYEDEECSNRELDIGCWLLKSCANNETFSEVDQKCVDETRRRRQQSLCQGNPSGSGCAGQTPCTAPNTNLQVGASCNWMTAPLVASSQVATGYMQCQQQSSGTCGSWQQQSCPMGAQFNSNVQTCVKSAVQRASSCAVQQAPVCGCAKQNICPGTSSCNQGTCCQSTNVITPTIRPMAIVQPTVALPSCPGSNMMAVAPCSAGCQSGYACQGGGCCPMQQQLPVCPGTGVQAVSSCSRGCPNGFGCRGGGCCPMPSCQNNQVATSFCNRAGSCPMGNSCSNGGCCPQAVGPTPISMPSCGGNQLAVSTCGGGSASRCPYGYQCQSGGCCPQAVPTCPNQTPSIGACNKGCPNGYSCNQGGCCPSQVRQPVVQQIIQQPMPMCPSTRAPATQSCSTGCPVGQSCYSGGCCPLLTCPQTGVVAAKFCDSGCQGGQSCFNGCCCPQAQVQPTIILPTPMMPSCPSGVMASQSCSSGCPVGTNCYQGGCCPLSTCPSGQMSNQFCANGCQSNSQCYQGSCCPQAVPQPIIQPRPIIQQTQFIPQPIVQNVVCPSGIQAQGNCNSGSGCMSNQACFQGNCCPQPTCPQTGQMANQFCSQGCPANNQCYQGSCCPSVQPMIQPLIQPTYRPQPIINMVATASASTVCPSGVVAQSSCSSGCQSNTQCYQGGCCPLATCPQSGLQAQSFCSQGCPQQNTCYQGSCCPQPVMQQVVRQPMPVCPGSNRIAQVSCNQGCPQQSQCYRGGCCPQLAPTQIMPTPVCPTGMPSVGSCNQGCPAQTQCYQGGCCPQQQVARPVVQQAMCPGNVAPRGSCSSGCGAQTQCYQGSCCPQVQMQPQIQPRCPGNVPSMGSCSSGCGAQTQCYQGSCCPMQQPVQQIQQVVLPVVQQMTCPGSNLPATGSCQSGCGVNMQCYQGGCCPMQQMQYGSGNTGYGNIIGQPLPTYQQPISTGCPGNVPSMGSCASGCGAQTQCNQGSCCPQVQPTVAILPSIVPTVISSPCGGGVRPVQACGIGSTCPSGAACMQNSCCPVATCGQNVPAVASCGTASRCPTGTSCNSGSCCQRTAQPICPTGAPAVSSCTGNSGCSAGYGCQNGGCCLQRQAIQTCPVAQTPVCQCATNSMCPSGLGCNKGTCCAGSQVSSYTTQYPGAPCQSSNQCSGFSAGLASCQKRFCQCTGGSVSNGVSCNQQQMNWSPRSSCGQFQSSCPLRFSNTKRKPVREAEVTNETIPLFFRAIETITRRCDSHCTCTPDEVCVDNKCLRRMVPGEYGCDNDLQCGYDCKDAFCDKETRQCKCAKSAWAFLEVGLCYKNCPPGTAETTDNRCKVVNKSKTFWESSALQRRLQDTHLCGAEKFRDCSLELENTIEEELDIVLTTEQ